MILRLLLSVFLAAVCARASDPLAWPASTRESRPWSYWWWMGSAVDTQNLKRELETLRAAGWGGVHIIPIYGAKGYESSYIDYLSPRWMEMLRYTVTEAKRLDMGVDMTTGTGWCFGGPTITPELASARAQLKTIEVASAQTVAIPAARVTAVVVSDSGQTMPLDPAALTWTAPATGHWRVLTVLSVPGPHVKRAAPGGTGYMLNPFYRPALDAFLAPFTKAFRDYDGPKPRAMYHDSFEYSADWSPDLLREFEQRRGYRLQDELPAFFGGSDRDRTARVKADYRETLSDLLLDSLTEPWVKWSHSEGFITRDEAHGSPGNLLDLYAAADIPETEMFWRDRSTIIAKFASSAAHVAGHPLVSSETGTWLDEHFHVTLAGLKDLIDQLLVAGVNHVFFHGTAYSPSSAPWPGWVFYASTQMNSRNAFWHDIPALAAYIGRAQSVLQSGKSGNDVLVYWPVADVWHNPEGLAIPFTVHQRDWIDKQPFGATVQHLLDRGYNLDYISDRQLVAARRGGYRNRDGRRQLARTRDPAHGAYAVAHHGEGCRTRPRRCADSI